MNEINKEAIYRDQFGHLEGPRCKLCGLPILIQHDTKILYGCPGCLRSFVKAQNGWITIEEYLDPDRILFLDDISGLSSEFQQLMNIAKENEELAQIGSQLGVVADLLGAYKLWADFGFKCMRNHHSEEALFSMVMALHDYHWNWGYWLNVAQMAANLYLFEIADRAIKIVEVMEPDYEPLARIRYRNHEFQNRIQQKYCFSSKNSKYSVSIMQIATDAFQAQHQNRAILRLKQSINLDPKNGEAWMYLGLAYINIKDGDQGELALTRALELLPNNALIYYYLMNVSILRLDSYTAIQMVKKAIELDPMNQRFLNKLLELEELNLKYG